MTPEGWCRVHLSDVADQRVEKVVPTATDDGPYVALEHLMQGSPTLLGWARARVAASAKTAFRSGDVLFGKLRPYLRKAAPAPFDGLCSTDILPLFGRSTLDTRYRSQLTQWRPLQQHAVATSSGTKMPRTSWTQLGAFSFPLPPLAEQRKIAAILSSVDDAIEKSQTVIDQAQVVKRGLMQELFNRTNSVDLVGKVAVFDHPARVSFASYLLRLRIRPDMGTGFWLSYLLNTDSVQKRLRANATVGVSQVNINRRSLLATVLPLPPMEEQSSIVSVLDSVWRRVEVERDLVARMAQVKSSLMSVLLTGELRVGPNLQSPCLECDDGPNPSAKRRRPATTGGASDTAPQITGRRPC